MNAKNRWDGAAIPDLDGRVAIVTGANSGIGLETARALAKNGATVVLACRNSGRANEAVEAIVAGDAQSTVQAMALDLADLESTNRFAQTFHDQFSRLDLLINNAGVMMPPYTTTKEGFELQFGVNHLGHFALTGLMLPLLAKTPGARVVNVASQAHRQGKIDMDDLDWRTRPYKRNASYGQSKLANLLFTFELGRRLQAAHLDIKSTAAHPGWTDSQLARHVPFARIFNPLVAMQPSQGALPTLRAAVDPDASCGDYFGPHGLFEMRGYPVKVQPAAAATDADIARRLWDASVARTGVDYALLTQP